MPVLRNVENMNYAQIEKGIEELGVKVCFIHNIKRFFFQIKSAFYLVNIFRRVQIFHSIVSDTFI